MLLTELVRHLDELLQVGKISDYCPNGLQVEGRPEVRRIVGGVTASQALLEAAIAANADAVLVHHGYFWKSEAPEITGMKRRRLQTLLQHDLSLLAYHLPLDVHAEFGNNVSLAKLLGFQDLAPLDPTQRMSIGLQGSLGSPLTVQAMQNLLTEKLGRSPQHVGSGPQQIKRIGWCTGAAQGMIEQAVAQGLDAYISGEISEPTVHIARECGIHYFAAGHHATERYGVQALGNYLQRKFGLAFEFIDIDNPV